ncbi:radical SAM protein [Desulfoferrobacter suflitae]|uniref:radical SAM protein n=1 Tax=Desulfoferrobacter suflitae TaxID=2865782 RepID=UPI002164064C|nr:radical SAM protein [Desulfoferrobacter suflitae]MCK8603873.1 radical SAM protein [Desulfoferrobacter suflitae]
MKNIFGPVPSRRLGRSLGIDVIPYKTCSFDCVYCESGHTTFLTVKRKIFVMPDLVFKELSDYFRKYPQGADAITFSSAGEPTLYAALGELLRNIKKQFPALPLVVITNGSLLWDPQVRKDLMAADRVVPSLDAATTEVFKKINAPHPSLDLSAVKEGLMAFRRDYRGQFNLEVLLVAGFNDHPDHLRQLRRFIDQLNPDQVELNTVVRPPAEVTARGLTGAQMRSALQFFPQDKSHIVGRYQSSTAAQLDSELASRVVAMVKIRPCTVSEMAASLGVEAADLAAVLMGLEQENLVERCSFNNVEYVRSAPTAPSHRPPGEE